MAQAAPLTRERVRTAQAGPVAGLIAQVLLLAVLAGTVGLGAAGWVVGVSCAVITNLALLRALVRYDCDRLGLADWVTLTRGSLAVGVAALVADSFARPAQVTTLVTLTFVALTLDAVDGWIVRHTGRATPLGKHFDGEVRRVPDRRAERLRRPIGGRLGDCDRGGTLRVLRRRLAAALDTRTVATARLAQGRRRDPGHRAGRRSCRRAATRPDPGRPPRRTRPALRIVRPRRRVAVGPPQRHARSRRQRSPTERSPAQSRLATPPPAPAGACAPVSQHCSRSSPCSWCGSPSTLRTSWVA